jgi:hypothetical protein
MGIGILSFVVCSFYPILGSWHLSPNYRQTWILILILGSILGSSSSLPILSSILILILILTILDSILNPQSSDPRLHLHPILVSVDLILILILDPRPCRPLVTGLLAKIEEDRLSTRLA